MSDLPWREAAELVQFYFSFTKCMYDYIIMNTHWSVFSLLPLHLTAEIWCSSGDNTSIFKVTIPFFGSHYAG